jgi:hypothetical protein
LDDGFGRGSDGFVALADLRQQIAAHDQGWIGGRGLGIMVTMIARASMFSLALVLLGACGRVPADVSSIAPVTGQVSDAPATAEPPLPDHCVVDELSACTYACEDSDCLAWCGGESCVKAITELHACMDGVEAEFYAQHPRPPIMVGQSTDADSDYVTPIAKWELARIDAIDEHWSSRCQAFCVEHLGPDSLADSGYCLDWDRDFHRWTVMPSPPTSPSAKTFGEGGILDLLESTASRGSSMSLARHPSARSAPSDPHSRALSLLLSHKAPALRGVEQCIPDLVIGTREYLLTVSIDPSGAVRSAHAVNDSAEGVQCVIDKVSQAITLPVRVARAFPRFVVQVEVRREPGMVSRPSHADNVANR